jgi:hypothetical protein
MRVRVGTPVSVSWPGLEERPLPSNASFWPQTLTHSVGGDVGSASSSSSHSHSRSLNTGKLPFEEHSFTEDADDGGSASGVSASERLTGADSPLATVATFGSTSVPPSSPTRSLPRHEPLSPLRNPTVHGATTTVNYDLEELLALSLDSTCIDESHAPNAEIDQTIIRRFPGLNSVATGYQNG